VQSALQPQGRPEFKAAIQLFSDADVPTMKDLLASLLSPDTAIDKALGKFDVQDPNEKYWKPLRDEYFSIAALSKNREMVRTWFAPFLDAQTPRWEEISMVNLHLVASLFLGIELVNRHKTFQSEEDDENPKRGQ
jgi:hypothetical protein